MKFYNSLFGVYVDTDDYKKNNDDEKKEITKENTRKNPSPYERTKNEVYATGNKWAIENFNATH
jgi:hypothetical protein